MASLYMEISSLEIQLQISVETWQSSCHIPKRDGISMVVPNHQCIPTER